MLQCDVRNLTFGEVLDLYEQVREDQWDHTAWVAAHCAKSKRKRSLKDFNPYKSAKRKPVTMDRLFKRFNV